MRNDNNYNNDYIDPTTIDAEKAELVAEETVPVEAKNSFWQNLKSFFVDGRTRFALGMVLILISTYLLIVMVSFFMTGDVDQSKILNSTPIELANAGDNVSNAGAALGAKLSNDLIYNGLGLGSLVLVIWSFVIGMRLIRRKKMYFFSFTTISLIAVCAISMTLAVLSIYFDLTFFPLGGNFGKYSCLFLIKLIGIPGV